ncbi:unnamed protein product, partial [Ectocarpus sp. 13 AM-2016]
MGGSTAASFTLFLPVFLPQLRALHASVTSLSQGVLSLARACRKQTGSAEYCLRNTMKCEPNLGTTYLPTLARLFRLPCTCMCAVSHHMTSIRHIPPPAGSVTVQLDSPPGGHSFVSL